MPLEGIPAAGVERQVASAWAGSSTLSVLVPIFVMAFLTLSVQWVGIAFAPPSGALSYPFPVSDKGQHQAVFHPSAVEERPDEFEQAFVG